MVRRLNEGGIGEISLTVEPWRVGLRNAARSGSVAGRQRLTASRPPQGPPSRDPSVKNTHCFFRWPAAKTSPTYKMAAAMSNSLRRGCQRIRGETGTRGRSGSSGNAQDRDYLPREGDLPQSRQRRWTARTEEGPAGGTTRNLSNFQ